MNDRVLAWFSCGAASAVAAHLAVEDYGDRVEVVYCDTMSTEHPDNARFFADVQQWLGVPIRKIRGRYESIDDVFEKTRYMAGIQGARCTSEMKKLPRIAYERPDDVHVFGFSADEQKRINRFIDNNFEMNLDFVLARHLVTKDDCFDILNDAGIPLPVMYDLGYKNNNCLGCVKATSANYWNMTRRDFPDVFEQRVRQSRELGVRLTRVRGTRVFLDELPEDYLPAEELEDISCGPDCGIPQEKGNS
jgi:3'-phosphoadenosine 5'-phosphosulfate sulfotransferase (PAPS reductase)/FAD synthetase